MSSASVHCLPPLRPIFARMNGVRSSFRRKPKPIYNLPKEQKRERQSEQERSQAPIIPLRHSLSGIDSEKEVHISQCSLEYEAEKEVHYPAKSVVARVLSPEPPYEEREENNSREELSAESKAKQHHFTSTTKAASPTPSYRSRDSSQDPEVVHTPSLILPIEEEPEEMIAGREEGYHTGSAADDDDDGRSSSGAGSEEEEDEETADEDEEDILFLPLQDFDGRDIVPQDARLRRPPSWDFGVPLLPLGAAHASVHSTAGEAAFSDPVSPMSPQQEKNPFSFRDTLSMRPLPPPPPQVKRNSWSNPDYEGAGWI